jgi:hypothetical protein
MASFQKQFCLFSTEYPLREPPQDLALNLKNGFVPKALVFVFNNMVALNLIFNIFFFGAALAACPARTESLRQPVGKSAVL